MNGSNRIDDVKRLYELLDELAARTHSLQPGLLSELKRGLLSESLAGGVYFFYEDGEHRLQSGDGDRIVWVG